MEEEEEEEIYDYSCECASPFTGVKFKPSQRSFHLYRCQVQSITEGYGCLKLHFKRIKHFPF
jgi:hypothetical protein